MSFEKEIYGIIEEQYSNLTKRFAEYMESLRYLSISYHYRAPNLPHVITKTKESFKYLPQNKSKIESIEETELLLEKYFGIEISEKDYYYVLKNTKELYSSSTSNQKQKPQPPPRKFNIVFEIPNPLNIPSSKLSFSLFYQGAYNFDRDLKHYLDYMLEVYKQQHSTDLDDMIYLTIISSTSYDYSNRPSRMVLLSYSPFSKKFIESFPQGLEFLYDAIILSKINNPSSDKYYLSDVSKDSNVIVVHSNRADIVYESMRRLLFQTYKERLNNENDEKTPVSYEDAIEKLIWPIEISNRYLSNLRGSVMNFRLNLSLLMPQLSLISESVSKNEYYIDTKQGLLLADVILRGINATKLASEMVLFYSLMKYEIDKDSF